MKRIGLILLGMLMVGVVSAEVKKIKGTGYLVVHDRQADQPFYPCFRSAVDHLVYITRKNGRDYRGGG